MQIPPRVCLVTGGSRGIGRGIALQLAEDGYSVAINYVRNADAARETCEECAAARRHGNQRFLPVRADIGDAEERNRLVQTVLSELGAIDALVNNAGIAPPERRDIIEAGESAFDSVIRVNLKGPYFLTQAVAKSWLSSPERSGRNAMVIFITSISSTTASVHRGEYCVAKAGLSMARQLWAVRLADEGIPVYEIRPGIMATDMTKGVKDKYDRLLETGLVPQRRWGTPKDVALAVSAVLEGKLPFSTGTVIDVDGGFQLRRL